MPEPEIREQLQAIQSGLRRSGREMVLSGGQALLRGALVLAGCLLSWPLAGRPWWQAAALWAALVGLGLGLELGLYLRLARRHPGKFVTGVERQMLKFIALVVAVGAVLSFALLGAERPGLIAGTWMLLVGTAYVAVGLFSFSGTWILGLAGCAGGAAALFLPAPWAFPLLGATLGAGSLAWGLRLRLRERRGEADAGV